MPREYHVMRDTKAGTRAVGHTRKLKPAILQAITFRNAHVTSGPNEDGWCEEVFRVSDSIFSGIPQAMKIAEEEGA